MPSAGARLITAGPVRAALTMPAAIFGAPNRMKHPRKMRSPAFGEVRPNSNWMPNNATAITAIDVPIEPSRRSSIQPTLALIAEVGGVAFEAVVVIDSIILASRRRVRAEV